MLDYSPNASTTYIPLKQAASPPSSRRRDAMDENTTYNDSKSSILNLTGQGPSSGVSPLEQEVLDEYERLSKNMKQVRKPPVLSIVCFHFAIERLVKWWDGRCEKKSLPGYLRSTYKVAD
jgi:hypothetical protein